jgi:hypothetical protein
MLFVHAHTGQFTVTDGRQERALYIRADRAALSYQDITRYAIEWLRRSATGGKQSVFLEKHDYDYLETQQEALATTSQAAAMINAHSMQTILHNPGHFLYGNVVEVMKLLYIEHDFTDSMNKYLRAFLYVVIYSTFIYALYRLSQRGDVLLKTAIALAAICIFYNCAVLSFFDVAQRYNTPYLSLFIIAAIAGLALRADESTIGQR